MNQPAPGPTILPVINRDFPDPDVQEVGNEFYAYSTNSVYDGSLVRLPIFRGTALTGPWHGVGEGMPELAAWVADPSHGGPNVWAPEITAGRDGGYLLYYTARHAAHQVQCLGVATSTSPTGPFQPVGADALVSHPDEGDSIDAESFIDADGTRYLIYKSGRTRSTMWLQRMSPDGLALDGDRVEILRSDRPEEANIIEAPTMVRRDSSYILFYSANTFNSGNYFVNYAIAPAVGGPYTKQPGALLTTDTIHGAYRNPGHEDVIAGPDGDYLIFHASIGQTERGMFVVGLDWTADGHPTVALDRPARVPVEV
jgi:arabinan endo-1,5-alpha-L-arabinosidase